MNSYILYGSQKGNAEYISLDLEDRLISELNKNPYRNTLNSAMNDVFEFKTNTVFIICSTTGNGEFPDNACKFWRTIKNRSLSKTLFNNIKYSILALGDTNYENFCGPGKLMDKRMKDLGAECIIPLACADDATNAEETINEWLNQVVHFCKKSNV